MTIRPIIFSTPMVQALLAGRKTQTRRLASSPLRRVEVGDRLWVREAWRAVGDMPGDTIASATSTCTGPEDIMFSASATEIQHALFKFRPSIHMPRWASRLTLEVTRVRFDRLQAISCADCIAEGIAPTANSQTIDCETDDPRKAFRLLWNSLHDKPGEGWDCDPQIVALTFKVHRANVDHISAGE